MAHDKQYVLNMIEALRSGVYTNRGIIEEMFENASALNDEEVNTEVKESLVYLVKNGILSASQGESIVRKYFSKMISEKNRNMTRSSPAAGPKPTIYGPYEEIYNFGSPVVVDMGRMSEDWIKEFNEATPSERDEILKPHIEAEKIRKQQDNI